MGRQCETSSDASLRDSVVVSDRSQHLREGNLGTCFCQIIVQRSIALTYVGLHRPTTFKTQPTALNFNNGFG